MPFLRGSVKIALLVIGCFLLAGCSRKTPLEVGPDWRALEQESARLLANKEYSRLTEFETSITVALTEELSAQELEAFGRLALYCAQARRLGRTGDPLNLLLKSEEAFRRAGSLSVVNQAKVKLATELAELTLYRRAVEVLSTIPESSAELPELPKQKQLLRNLLAVVRPSLEGLGTDVSPIDRDGRIKERLLDLLALVPQNSYYDELSLVEEQFESAVAFFSESAPFAQTSLLLQLEELQPSVEEDVDYLETEEEDLFSSWQLTSEQLALQDIVGNGLSVSEEGIVRLADEEGVTSAFNELVRSISGEMESRTLLHRQGLLMLYQDPEDEYSLDAILAFLPFRDGGSAWRLSLSASSQLSLKDVNSDGIEEVIITNRQGSGSFFDIFIVEVESTRDLFSTVQHYRGDAVLLDLDADKDQELILTEAFSDGLIFCNQCPRRWRSIVYDLDSESESFLMRGSFETASEFMHGGGNPWGLEAHMSLLDSEMSGDSTLLRKIKELPANQLSESMLKEVNTAIFERSELLRQAQFPGAAAELLAEVVEALDGKDLSTPWIETRVRAHLGRVSMMSQDGRIEAALKELEEPWYLRAAQVTTSLDLFGKELRGMLCLNLGRLDEAYDAIEEIAATIGEPREEIEGNRALYFTLVGDYATARELGLTALDLANRHDNAASQFTNMMHLASTAANQKKYGESLDWLSRSLRWSRGSRSGQTTGLLEIAASVALDNKYPQISLALLDEAIALTDTVTWNLQGGSLLLLYAKALLALGHHDRAVELLEVSAKLARRPNASVYVAAHFEQSKLAYASGDLTGALAHAREAFEGISTGRRLIRVEQHKFSFLVDKEAVAAWFFKLMIESRASSVALFDTVASWKMQTFLDVYAQTLATSDGLKSGSSLAESMKIWLGPGDLMVDFIVTDEVSFALLASRDAGLRLALLPCEASSLRKATKAIISQFNIRDSSVARSIRDDKMSEDLGRRLDELGRCLLGSLDIPPETQRLLLVPDKDLIGLPWSALLFKGDPLLAHFEVVLVPSSRFAILQSTRRKARGGTHDPSKRRALVVGALGAVSEEEVRTAVATEFSRQRFSGLPALANGWKECRSVAEALEPIPVRFLLDSSMRSSSIDGSRLATPENFLQELESARVAHVVAHGVFNPITPMRSVLFLETGKKGRTVTAIDLARRDLRNVSLISLAACQTGVSGAAPGAEPIGFIRALLGGGVENVVLTEWEVDDRTTSEIFTAFYANMKKSRRSAALREAQLAVQKRYRHPYFWAGVSLYGS